MFLSTRDPSHVHDDASYTDLQEQELCVIPGADYHYCRGILIPIACHLLTLLHEMATSLT